MISGIVMLNHQVANHRDPRTTKQLQPRYLAVGCREGALEESGGFVRRRQQLRAKRQTVQAALHSG